MPRTTVSSQGWSLKPLVTWGLLPLGPHFSLLLGSWHCPLPPAGALHMLVHLVEFLALFRHWQGQLLLLFCISACASVPLDPAHTKPSRSLSALPQCLARPVSEGSPPQVIRTVSPLSPPDGKLHAMVSSSKPGVLSALNEYLVGNQRVVFILFLVASFESE